MRLEILTADVLEALNAQEIYQLIQEHSPDEFSELEQQYNNKHKKLLNEMTSKGLMTYGQKMLRIESIIESHRRALAMRGFCQLKSANATVEQIDENLRHAVKLQEAVDKKGDSA